MGFYNDIAQSIAEESQDNNKYTQLAMSAPTEKARKILLDIAQEEQRHKEYLNEILSESKSQSEKKHVPAATEPSK